MAMQLYFQTRCLKISRDFQETDVYVLLNKNKNTLNIHEPLYNGYASKMLYKNLLNKLEDT